MENIQLAEYLQGLLEKYNAVLSDTDKAVIQQVCLILITKPASTIDWVLIIKTLAQVLVMVSHFHH